MPDNDINTDIGSNYLNVAIKILEVNNGYAADVQGI